MMVDILFFLASLTGHLCFIGVFLIIGDLSRILGVALKKKSVYKLMYLCIALIVGGLVFSFFGKEFALVSGLLDLFGVLLACIVTLYYWKWLPGDLAKG